MSVSGITINPKYKSLVPPLSKDEIHNLEQSLIKEGCRDPLVLWNGILIDGHNRYELCTKHHIAFETISKEFEDELNVLIWIRLNQVSRRNLTDDQRAINAYELSKLMSEKAKIERAKKGGETGGIGRPKENSLAHTSCAKLSDEPKPRTERSAEKAAKASNVSRRKVEQAKFVSDHDPKLAEKVAMGEIPLANAVRDIKRAEIIDNLENIENKKIKELAGEYDVIVIDPPWQIEKIERDERPNQAILDYPTMTEEELAKMKMPAASDCHFWIWTTHKFLPTAFKLLDVWGMKYVCTFVWHKPGGFQPVGLPQYNCEFALYARKGSPKFIDTKALPVCFNAARTGHSEKPEEFYEVVRRVTAGRRIDIFNRRKIEGFDGWGKESDVN